MREEVANPPVGATRYGRFEADALGRTREQLAVGAQNVEMSGNVHPLRFSRGIGAEQGYSAAPCGSPRPG